MSKISRNYDQKKELHNIISSLVDMLTTEAADVKKELGIWMAIKEDSLEKLATITELKIRKAQIKRLLTSAQKVIKKSTYMMVVATIDLDSN